MTAISSIHFKQSIANNLYHNDRSKEPSYLLKDGGLGVEVNRSATSANKLYAELLAESTKNYYERRHQKIQTKCNRWSAVVNIKENTTMSDLEKLAQHFKDKYKFTCLQIAIHRDEGHIDKDTKEVKINHHAHLEFYTLDKDGINCFKKNQFGKKRMSEIQTEVAEILGMQRGEFRSKKVRLEHKQYKSHIKELESKEKQIEKQQKKITDLEQELKQEKSKQKSLTKKAVKERLEAERKAMKDKGFTAQDFRALNALNKSTFDTQEDLEEAIKNLHEEIEQRRQAEKQTEIKTTQLKELKQSYKNEVGDLKEQIEQRDRDFLMTKIKIEELEKINRELKEEYSKSKTMFELAYREEKKKVLELEKKNKQLKEENSKIKSMYNELVKEFNELKNNFTEKVKEVAQQTVKQLNKQKDNVFKLLCTMKAQLKENAKQERYAVFKAIDDQQTPPKVYTVACFSQDEQKLVQMQKIIDKGVPVIVKGKTQPNKDIVQANSVELDAERAQQLVQQYREKQKRNNDGGRSR